MTINTLEIDFGDHVATWTRGDAEVLVWHSAHFRVSGYEPAHRLAVPAGTEFSQAALDRLARALLDEQALDDDGEPDMDSYAQRAKLLNQAAVFEPVTDPDEQTPALVVAGVAAHLYLDREHQRFVVGIHLDEVPEWLVGEDGTVPITVHLNRQTILK